MKLAAPHIKTLLILLFVVVIAVVGTLLILEKGKSEALIESQAGKALRVESEEAAYTDIAGSSVSLDAYLGQNLVVHSWASWCPQCVDQLKLFSSVVSIFPETKLIAINRGEDGVTAERFLNHYNLWSDVELLLDPTDHFYKSIGGFAMPETVIFDKNGSVAAHFRGIVSQQDIESALQNLAEN
jgi:thiol-disulfide isomerase/thioredoxin